MGRLRARVGAVLLILVSAAAAFGSDLDRLDLKEGDILFQASRSAQSRAIQLATHSRWSHMGMLVREREHWMVLEAVQPVKLTPLKEWMKRGQGGHGVIKRLKDADERLDAQVRARMRETGKRLLGRPYDLTFEWNDRRIYCSELVWKIYKEGAGLELGSLQRLRDFDLSHPAVRRIMEERFGAQVPMDEPVISPQAMFECPLLITVFER